jgi:hypothetical protein
LGLASAIVTPAVDAASIECGEKNECAENKYHGNRAGQRRDTVLGVRRGRRNLRRVSQVVFGEEGFFVEAEIASDGADKATVEDAARELIPIFVFEGVEEARANASGGSNFFKRDLTQFPLTFETFSEGAPSHAVEV